MIKKILSALCFLLPSAVTCAIYRMLGHKIGKNTKIPVFSFVYADEIEIGNDVDIRPLVFIMLKRLCIGNNSIISYGVQIKGNKSFVTRDNCMVGVNSVINCEDDVYIGFYSCFGPKCTVYTHGSFLPVTQGYPAKFEKVVLEDYVWTGMNVTYMPGAYVESDCIINPGVIIKSKIKSGSIVEVNPGVLRVLDLNRLRKFQKKNDLEICEKILVEFFEYSGMNYSQDNVNKQFYADKKHLFKYFSEENRIELCYGKKVKILYDLQNFYTDDSRLKIHKEFLFFLRRRFGITLRTKYMD